jgi:hypothetical protein
VHDVTLERMPLDLADQRARDLALDAEFNDRRAVAMPSDARSRALVSRTAARRARK